MQSPWFVLLAQPFIAAHWADDGRVFTAEKWLLTLFMYNWPYKVALRMWDVIIMDGPTAFFGFALSVFELSKSELLQMDTEQLLLFLTGTLCICRCLHIESVALTSSCPAPRVRTAQRTRTTAVLPASSLPLGWTGSWREL